MKKRMHETSVRGYVGAFMPAVALALLFVTGMACEESPQVGEETPCCQTVIPARLEPILPYDIADHAPRNQCSYDHLAWQAFIALNWPAQKDVNGEPDTDQAFGAVDDTGWALPVVWETYRQTYEVFQDQAANPCPNATDEPGLRACWDRPGSLNPDYPDAEGKVLDRTMKISSETQVLDEIGALAPTTDQNGFLARGEASMNWEAFKYIVENQYYDASIQARARSIDFPSGVFGRAPGAIEVKVSWRKLVECDAPRSDACANVRERYHARETVVYYDSTANPVPQVYGLVAIHFVYKTKSTGVRRIWSTFEHVDNAPTRGDSIPAQGTYSFYDPACDTCKVNQTPARRGNVLTATLPEVNTDPSIYPPSQVIRIDPIPNPSCTITSEGPEALNNTAQMNREMQQLFAGTPWQYYELVNTQWPRDPDYVSVDSARLVRNITTGLPQPVMVRNTVLETFFVEGQYPNQINISSCLGCHNGAVTTSRDSIFADMSYFLAHEAHCPPGTIAAPDSLNGEPYDHPCMCPPGTIAAPDSLNGEPYDHPCMPEDLASISDK